MRIRLASFVVAILAPTVMVAGPIQSAFASTPSEANAASTAVSRLLAEWAPNGALFDSTANENDCSDYNSGDSGNCWWWGAVTWNALITYTEDNPNVIDPNSDPAETFKKEIENDLWSSYNTICKTAGLNNSPWSACPTSPNQNGTDPFTVNFTGTSWYDDIGWWTQTWLNAYKLVGRPDYLDLAEELWNYTTGNGYHLNQNSSNPNPCGGIPQDHDQVTNSFGLEDAFANALYLRNSAWLYTLTPTETFNAQYMQGRDVTWTSGLVGGADYAAQWIRSNLIFKYTGPALGNAGAVFMIADHSSWNSGLGECEPAGAQWQLHGQGEVVQAWTAMATACSTYSECPASSSYYDNLADELARSVVSDAAGNDQFYPDNLAPWQSENPPNQDEPTVDSPSGGVLTDPCDPPSGSSWPYGCDLGSSASNYKPWLISKGVFQQAIYCLTQQDPDSELTSFISQNASAIAQLSHFGEWWDNSAADASVVISATQTSVLDGLDADLGGSTLMC